MTQEERATEILRNIRSQKIPTDHLASDSSIEICIACGIRAAENDALERAALAVSGMMDHDDADWRMIYDDCAAAVRALKHKDSG